MHIEASLSLTRRPKFRTPESTPQPYPNTVRSAQRRIADVVVGLTELEYELHEICESLPIASDQGAMEDECVATDVPMWLRSTLHQVRHKPVRQAIERLREAAQRTEDDQRYAFYKATL